MSAPDLNTSFATTIVDEWVRAGVTHAVVAAGSRNTPLLLALHRDGRVAVDMVLDERSAGFRALGIGLATGRPAIVCCTSGTAAANLHPAVVEAHHARVPLLVCTADRPPELRDVGAPQTIDQTHLYGRAVRWFHDPGPPGDPGPHWRTFAARAFAAATGSPPGPVHCNLPFREPLVPTGGDVVVPASGPAGARTPRSAPADLTDLAPMIASNPRGLLVAGWSARVTPATAAAFTAATGWPVLADPLSQLRCGAAISTYEALARAARFAGAHRPDLVIRVGAPLTSKVTNAWLASVPTVLVASDGVWLDPDHTAIERVAADEDATLAALAGAVTTGATDWTRAWQSAEARARVALDLVLDEDIACEARVARDLATALPDGFTLVVGSSLPVRALEWAMAPRSGLRVLANRGANGIDGFVSTTLGVARGTGSPTVGLTGDLGFLHDTNGLLTAAGTPPATIVVVDNDGGGIFGYLPQHELPEFESLFATPPATDVVAVARAHGVAAERVENLTDLAKRAADEAPATRVLVVTVDRETSIRHHRAVWDAVAIALA
jgi:2-succinyl-5-enolpyruvyl-6-hydroxy-3-cyclohexene-1-carboxylate synthase